MSASIILILELVEFFSIRNNLRESRSEFYLFITLYGLVILIGYAIVNQNRKLEKEREINYEKFDRKYKELRIEKESVDRKVAVQTKELRESNHSLHCALDELTKTHAALLQVSNQKMASFISQTLAHEIGNTIFPVENNLITLERYVSEIIEKDKKTIALELISRVQTQMSTITDTLSSIKVNTDLTKNNLENIKLKEIIDLVVLMLNYMIVKNNIKMYINVNKNETVYANKNGLHRVFTNLILNAIAAMPDGGLIEIRSSVSDKTYDLYVCDSGVGIPNDILDKIFEPLFTTKSKNDGTGIGLYIVRKELEKCNATIKVISELGNGTDFILSFPII